MVDAVIERFATDEEGAIGTMRRAPINRLLICMPTTGIVRFEWAMQFTQLIYPVNWAQSIMAPRLPIHGPMGFAVAGARNECVRAALEKGFEWILFIDTDTIPPADILIRLNDYLLFKTEPVVAGVYYHKGMPSYPLVFRGRGNGPFLDWNRGDLVRVDAVPMGCTLIHTSLFEHLPQTELTDGTGGRGWFDTPRFASEDPETGAYIREVGTEDMHWCDRIITHDVLRKAGWTKQADEEFPFLIDSRIWCTHIDGAGSCFPPQVPKPGVNIRRSLEG